VGQRIIVIIGPTCSGKTYLSLKLSSLINGEIISADSRQIYKRLNIGSAKPSSADIKKIKHHFVDMLNLDEAYDANKFSIDADKIIDDILGRNKSVVVVGGSGLYIKSLIDGIVDSAEKDEDLRNKLLKKKEKFGNEFLHNELKKVDPVSADNMLPQNWKRVIRALEVYYLTGKTIDQHHKTQKNKSIYDFYQVGLMWPREILYKRSRRSYDS
jgi:tRNA dimethylallyltransferase